MVLGVDGDALAVREAEEHVVGQRERGSCGVRELANAAAYAPPAAGAAVVLDGDVPPLVHAPNCSKCAVLQRARQL